MTKLVRLIIIGTFARAGVAIAQDKKATAEKLTAEESEKAMEAKKELVDCERGHDQEVMRHPCRVIEADPGV
jgi:hypothetical protein